MSDIVHRLQKYVTIMPVVVEGSPDAHNVFLQVTNQRFCVTPYACDTKNDAEWTRDMLCIALEKIVESENEHLRVVLKEIVHRAGAPLGNEDREEWLESIGGLAIAALGNEQSPEQT